MVLMNKGKSMSKPTYTQEVNAICQEIALEAVESDVASLVADLEEEEINAMMLSLGPRAFGPDFDAGADDCNGQFYWDLK
jgi:hypothetical protein